jgi:hypothetical protein
MLSVQLMLEVNRRCNHDAGELLLRDACLQAAYCMDAPDEVQDGMHWWDDPELDVHGAVPRVVELREPANARLTAPDTAHRSNDE